MIRYLLVVLVVLAIGIAGVVTDDGPVKAESAPVVTEQKTRCFPWCNYIEREV